eukprot:gb/GEZN01014216.1/.p1 GENE.gb/GEZN01014216.1/~~gb/GEZN01014216.1/.p1  ORF type:complete len:306 (+),score=13.74 gb/GEZN01014216.1/:96-920(+)
MTKTAVAPLERIKILYQVQDMLGHTGRYNTVIGSLRSILTQEGFFGLYRGNGANILRILPNYSLKFMFNDTYKRAFARPGQDLHNLGFVQLIQAGWLAGLCQASITYPLEVVRTRLALDDRMAGPKRGIIGTTLQIFRTEGAASLYKGYSITFISTPVYVGLQMSLYDIFKRQFRDSEGQISATGSFSAGAAAGLIAQTTAYPGDTIKKQLQSNGINGVERKYKGLVDCVRKIYLRGGIKAFYPGLGINTVKCIPEAGLQFVIYDSARKYLEVY